MADDTERPVETLKVGELIIGIDGEPQVIEEIQSGLADTIRVTTENGFTARTSLTHAYALPKGGFVVAAHSLGKTISTENGPSKIVDTTYIGKTWVFNIITNGSHTYRVDGIWSLGVGEAERHVGMNEWAKVGSKLMTAVA
jgi:hypothetical protein